MDRTLDAPELLLRMVSGQATKLMLDAPSPPIFFQGDRMLTARDFSDSLSPEQCKELVHSLLSKEQRRRLERDHSIMVAFDVPGISRYRMTATAMGGVYSALITASA